MIHLSAVTKILIGIQTNKYCQVSINILFHISYIIITVIMVLNNLMASSYLQQQ